MLFLRKPKNIFCLDTYVIRDRNCIGYCCKDPSNLKEKIKIAIDAGYDAVELWHKDVHGFLTKEKSFSELKHIMQNKIFVASYKVLEGWFEGENKNHQEIIETASMIGAKSIVVKLVGDSKNFREEPISYYVNKYEKLLKFCEPFKINPSLEFMCLANTMNSIDKVYKILNETNGFLILDTWHLWRRDDENFSKFRNTIENLDPKWISVIHFTDASKDIPRESQVDGDRKLPNLGCLNLKEFCRIIDSKNFKGTYSLNVYDRSLWNEDALQVATKGLALMKQCINNYENKNTTDSKQWDQKIRCDHLWNEQYYTHLDPRILRSNRDQQMVHELSEYLQDKIVLDFKCGFSPLANYVTYGFDAYNGCIKYLKNKYPNANWFCQSDLEFSNNFKEKIDVLLHIGLGDSNTEEESHYKIRKNCKPKIIIIECAANPDGTVSESKIGNQKRWQRLSEGLKIIKIKLIKTNMSERSYRLLLVGENNDI